MAFTRDSLWAAKVQVDGVTVRGDESRGSEEVWRGVGAELDECRAVRGTAVEEGCLKGLCTVGGGCSEEAGVEHGGVAEGVGGGVPTGEETPGLGRLSVWGEGQSEVKRGGRKRIRTARPWGRRWSSGSRWTRRTLARAASASLREPQSPCRQPLQAETRKFVGRTSERRERGI